MKSFTMSVVGPRSCDVIVLWFRPHPAHVACSVWDVEANIWIHKTVELLVWQVGRTLYGNTARNSRLPPYSVYGILRFSFMRSAVALTFSRRYKRSDWRMYITSQQSYMSQINTRQTSFEAYFDSKRKSRDCSPWQWFIKKKRNMLLHWTTF